MRIGVSIACTVAIFGASIACAEADPFVVTVPAGFSGTADPFVGTVERPGIRLSHSLRLRIDGMRDNLDDVAHGVTPLRKQTIDRSRRRGMSSMLDFFPTRDSGFHLTAGMRRSPKRARWSPAASSAFDIFTPKLSNPQLIKSNVARSSPVAMIGWSGELGHDAFLSLSGGAIQEHAKALKANTAMIARQQSTTAGWSRVGEVAQATFAVRF